MRQIVIGSFIVVVMTVGCDSSGSQREAVSGKVSFKGQPLAKGTIEFMPVDSGVKTFATGFIENGEYTIDSSKGLVPGEYRVSISSTTEDKAADPNAPPGVAVPARELIPPKYNAQTKLTKTVNASADNTFDFNLN